MPVPIVAPPMGETVSELVITRWLKSEGDRVTAGEPLVEVGADKVDMEIEAPATGVLTEILVPADETVDVGTHIGLIRVD